MASFNFPVNQALQRSAVENRVWNRGRIAAQRMASALLLFAAASCSGGGGGGSATSSEVQIRLDGPSGFEISGPEGGPFSASNLSLRLVNEGVLPVEWFAEPTATWITLSATSGALLPGFDTVLQLAVDGPQSTTLGLGMHQSLVSVRERNLAASASGGGGELIVREAPGNGERFIGEIDVTLRVVENGWTRFVESHDTRKVYVSESHGNDANDGLSEATPKRTIAAGKALMRQGYPDWLLLRRGDTWYEAIGQWTKGGRSPHEPILVSSYGESNERPKLRTGNASGIWAIGNTGGTPPSLNHVAIVGLDFHAHTYVGVGEPAGVSWLVTSNDLLVEDCLIDGYQINVAVPGHGGRKSDIKIRRNVLTNAFATTGTVGHGIYMANCDNVLIEENVLDHNGWNPAVSGAVPSIFRHGIYIQSGSGTCTEVTVRRNIIANSASHGLQLRPGGVVEDNLFLRNSIALLLGGGNEPNPGGIGVECTNNVILDAKDIDANNRRGWGIQMQNINSGLVRGNIVANRTGGGFPIPMQIDGQSGSGVFNLALESNVIYNWGGTMAVVGTDQQVGRVRIFHNSFDNTRTSDQLLSHSSSASVEACISAGNRFSSTQPNQGSWLRVGSQNMSVPVWANLMEDTTSHVGPANFLDPDRTIATYDRQIGGAGSLESFLAQARLQSKANWRFDYTAAVVNNYIRDGFFEP
ncbi:MAG: right-handed parallel beta-helix repeat-containing protein [Planctomycetes bacterium]|nr:right-handed parallel beta-helix repeat-containing protein [Planctomycetota bacterium]